MTRCAASAAVSTVSDPTPDEAAAMIERLTQRPKGGVVWSPKELADRALAAGYREACAERDALRADLAPDEAAAYWKRRAETAWRQLDVEAAQRMALHSELSALRADLAVASGDTDADSCDVYVQTTSACPPIIKTRELADGINVDYAEPDGDILGIEFLGVHSVRVNGRALAEAGTPAERAAAWLAQVTPSWLDPRALQPASDVSRAKAGTPATEPEPAVPAVAPGDTQPAVIAAVESAIVDLTGRPQVGAAYAKAFIKRLAENGVEVRALAEAGADIEEPTDA